MKPKDCTCKRYRKNEPHEYSCALNINQAMTTDKATARPTPWYSKGTTYAIFDSKGIAIAKSSSWEVRDAIVKAVNSHDALKDALIDAEKALERMEAFNKDDNDNSLYGWLEDKIDKILSSLAKD